MKYTIYADGSFRIGKKGGFGIICYSGSDIIFKISEFISGGDSVAAEMKSIVRALDYCNRLKINNDEIILYNDVKWLINLLNGSDYSGISKKYITIYNSLIKNLYTIKNIKFEYIKSEYNKAHKLAYEISKGKSENILYIKEDINKEKQINISQNNILSNNITNNDINIISFLENQNKLLLQKQQEINNMIQSNLIINKLLVDNNELKNEHKNDVKEIVKLKNKLNTQENNNNSLRNDIYKKDQVLGERNKKISEKNKIIDDYKKEHKDIYDKGVEMILELNKLLKKE